MDENQIYMFVVFLWMLACAVGFVTLFFVKVPMGKLTHTRYGKMTLPIDNRIGWLIMELPSPLMMSVYFIIGRNHDLVSCFLLTLWLIHYINRTFIFPFRIEKSSSSMTLIVIIFGILFNVFNSYLNGRLLFTLSTPPPPSQFFSSWNFVIGFAMFASGLFINIHSDEILMSLRKKKEKTEQQLPKSARYKIPQGGFFEYVSCANYFGEMLEWLGFFVMTVNIGAFCFVIGTYMNLIPRAYMNHKWYKETFPNYPPNRKAVIPFLF